MEREREGERERERGGEKKLNQPLVVVHIL